MLGHVRLETTQIYAQIRPVQLTWICARWPSSFDSAT
jgi:site-specific recombinase XerD